MEPWYKNQILSKLNNDSKVMIGLGDSFTSGEDACSIELWEKYNWDLSNASKEIDEDLSRSFLENSWVHQICKNYLYDYIPINLGIPGRGNRAAIKEIYFHPEFELNKKKEIIVIYMLSGMERFDFVHDNYNEFHHFRTIWPRIDYTKKISDQQTLWNAYSEHIWGGRFGVTELLFNVAEVKNWCKAHNAKLMVLSAFRPDYQKEEFIRLLKTISDNDLNKKEDYLEMLVDIIDWDNFVRLSGYNCVTDFLCALEGREDLISGDFFAVSEKFYNYSHSHKKLSENGFISKSGHPSFKGHYEIAKQLYENIKMEKFFKL